MFLILTVKSVICRYLSSTNRSSRLIKMSKRLILRMTHRQMIKSITHTIMAKFWRVMVPPPGRSIVSYLHSTAMMKFGLLSTEHLGCSL